jgi:hypothetical protein
VLWSIEAIEEPITLISEDLRTTQACNGCIDGVAVRVYVVCREYVVGCVEHSEGGDSCTYVWFVRSS